MESDEGTRLDEKSAQLTEVRVSLDSSFQLPKNTPVRKHADNEHHGKNRNLHHCEDVVEIDSSLSPDAVDDAGARSNSNSDGADDFIMVLDILLASGVQDTHAKRDGVCRNVA